MREKTAQFLTHMFQAERSQPNTNTNALSTFFFNSYLSLAVFFPLYLFFTAALIYT